MITPGIFSLTILKYISQLSGIDIDAREILTNILNAIKMPYLQSLGYRSLSNTKLLSGFTLFNKHHLLQALLMSKPKKWIKLRLVDVCS